MYMDCFKVFFSTRVDIINKEASCLVVHAALCGYPHAQFRVTRFILRCVVIRTLHAWHHDVFEFLVVGPCLV